MARQVRLDLELVRRGLAPSRAAARRAVESGAVSVRGFPVDKASTLVSSADPIELALAKPRFVSRGGDKLAGALDLLEVRVSGRKWLDAGASTGGFTDCLLQAGAETVIAADVGYGQLAWGLRNDPRVIVLERVNVRELQASDLPWTPQAVAADLSFISLTSVLLALSLVAEPGADFVLLVKPQFEVGRAAVGRGVVRDPALWVSALEHVTAAARDLGLGLAGGVVSALRGPAGNTEFFVHLRRDPPHVDPQVTIGAMVMQATLEGDSE